MDELQQEIHQRLEDARDIGHRIKNDARYLAAVERGDDSFRVYLRLEKEYRQQQSQEYEQIDELIKKLSQLRRQHDALPHRPGEIVQMSPIEYNRWFQNGGIEDFFHQHHLGELPSQSMTVVLTPEGKPLYLYYVIEPGKRAWYDRAPMLPRPLREEAEQNMWTEPDIEHIYGLPQGLLAESQRFP